MKLSKVRAVPLVLTFAALFFSDASHAGRPLSVDDANTADVGTGNIDLWYTRFPGSVNVWTIAPAYGITEGIEIAASFAPDTTSNTSATTLGIKFRFTPSQKDGCNLGSSVGVTQASPGGGNTSFINGLLTCSGGAGSVNLNLGLTRAPDSPTLKTWGVSFERELGAFTPHIEVFGVEQSAPTVQLGLRTMVTKKFQLDGSVGSNSGETNCTLGMRFFF